MLGTLKLIWGNRVFTSFTVILREERGEERGERGGEE